MNPIQERLRQHHEKKLEQLNEKMRMLRDAALLSEFDCQDVIRAINLEFPGRVSEIAHWLRGALSLAIDVIRTENGLAKFK